jgi:hypothetical protein
MATTPMAILATTAIGALMYLIVIMFVPYVGGSVQSSMPALGVTSDFNSTHNTALPNASTTWTTIAGFLQIAAIFAVMALVFMFLRGMI